MICKPLNWRFLREWCRTQRVFMSMQHKVLLMTVFSYISENVLQFTKRWFVNPPILATMLVPRLLEGARPGAGGQEAGQGAVPPVGEGGVSFGWCPALPGHGGGMVWRDRLSAMSLQEPKIGLSFLIFQGLLETSRYCRLNPGRYIHTSNRISESTSRVREHSLP